MMKTVMRASCSSTQEETDLHCPRVADQITGQLQRLQGHQVRWFLRLRPRLLVGAAEGPQSKETWCSRPSG